LGDLNALVQEFAKQKQVLDSFVVDMQAKKDDIDAIPEKIGELDSLIAETVVLKDGVNKQLVQNHEISEEVEAIKIKADEIQKLSLTELGLISNEKLSNSFDKIRKDLKDDNKKWFWWLFGTSVFLILAFAGIVFWQVCVGDTIFEISFLIKLALTSPIIFFEVFVSKQYARIQRLVEEYEFKSSVARSLETYKEVIIGIFPDMEGDECKKKLDFILGVIDKIYSSPMDNIRINQRKEICQNEKTVTPLLSDIKGMISDIKNLTSKVNS
jgi:membrane protein implicated in regulation of membrane protease activity